MRLTDEMKSEVLMISCRVSFLNDKFLADAPHATFSIHVASLKEQHGGELESYKIKLENFYLETDIRGCQGKAFQISFYQFKHLWPSQ